MKISRQLKPLLLKLCFLNSSCSFSTVDCPISLTILAGLLFTVCNSLATFITNWNSTLTPFRLTNEFYFTCTHLRELWCILIQQAETRIGIFEIDLMKSSLHWFNKPWLSNEVAPLGYAIAPERATWNIWSCVLYKYNFMKWISFKSTTWNVMWGLQKIKWGNLNKQSAVRFIKRQYLTCSWRGFYGITMVHSHFTRKVTTATKTCFFIVEILNEIALCNRMFRFLHSIEKCKFKSKFRFQRKKKFENFHWDFSEINAVTMVHSLFAKKDQIAVLNFEFDLVGNLKFEIWWLTYAFESDSAK